MTNRIPTDGPRVRVDAHRVLTLLNAIALNERVTQRQLARELGVAVSLANLRIRELAHQGLIRVITAHPSKVRYLLTSKGAEERTRLAYGQLCSSFTRYRELCETVRRILRPHMDGGARRFALCGAGVGAEVAYLCLKSCGVEEVVVFAFGREVAFLGIPVQGMHELAPENFDRFVVTPVDPLESAVDVLAELARQGIPEGKIVSLAGPVGNAPRSPAEPARIVKAV